MGGKSPPQHDLDPLPSWAWSVAFVTALTAMTVVAAVALHIAWQGDRHEIEEHRALAQARFLGHITSKHGPDTAQRTIEDLRLHHPKLAQAFAVTADRVDTFGISRGQRYVVNLDPTLRNRELTTLSKKTIHKARFDRYAFAISGANAKRRPGRAAPEFSLEVDTSPKGVLLYSAQIPFAVQNSSKQGAALSMGSAGVSLQSTSPNAPAPLWLLALFTLLLGFLGALALHTLQRRNVDPSRALAGSIIASGLILLVTSLLFYQNTYQHEIAQSAEGLAHAVQSSLRAGLSPQEATTALAHADVSFIGSPNYLFGTHTPALVSDQPTYALKKAALFTHSSGRSPVIWASLLLSLALLTAARTFLARVCAKLRTNPYAYAYVLPSMLGMVALVFVPFAFGVGMSLFDNDARRYYFVGIGNFIEILGGSKTSDVSFYWTLFVTFLWTFMNVILHVSIGLGLALILKEPTLRFKSIYRVLLVIPWAVPNYITALIWKGMFNKEFGAINLFLEKIQLFLGMTPTSIDWLGGSFATAFTANLVTNTWLGFPFMMVVSLGALQSIPGALYEAAEVDGASRWQQFTNITLPLLKPALFPAIILGSIWTFNMFNVIYLVSGGGPNNSTEILITDAYRAFDVLGRYGFAAAYSVLIFGILLLYTVLTNRVTQATEGAFD